MYYYNNSLYHYGVKGMKWGVRRTPEQLGHKQKRIDKSKKEGIIRKDESSEKDLLRQSSTSIRRGIRSHAKAIAEHRKKCSDPEAYDPKWNTYDDRKKKGIIKHWQKEIDNFQKSIENAIRELSKRGDSNE